MPDETADTTKVAPVLSDDMMREQNKRKRQELLQACEGLHKRLDQFQENLRDHGKNVDKMVVQDEKLASQVYALGHRVSRVETKCVALCAAVVAAAGAAQSANIDNGWPQSGRRGRDSGDGRDLQ